MKNKFGCMGGVLTSLLLALLFSLASCDNGSTTNPPENNSDIDYSLGTPPDEELKIPDDKITADENCADGIYIKYAIPQGKDAQSCTACIDGIGLVYENYGLEGKSEDELFYPFVTPGKEYTVRFVFNSKEIERDGWNYGGAECVGWFDAKVKAGPKSKGEVRLTDKGEIEVKANGDFRFTKRSAFEGESRLNANGGWYMNVCLVEGVSWLHDDRKTKWRGELNVPSAEIESTINLYTYDENDSWRDGGEWDIDFLCVRPRMKYAYGGKEYLYQWDNVSVHDTPQLRPEAELWQTVDINNSADVNKIVGTWNWLYRWEGWYDKEETLKVKELYEEILVINSANVTETDVSTYTKADGKAFTNEEIKAHFCHTELSDSLPENEDEIFAIEEGSFSYGDSDKPSESEKTFRYKIYMLDSNNTVSSDNKTITYKYSNDAKPISEYFADEKNDDSNYTRHYTVKLFEGGNALRIVHSGTNSAGSPYEWYIDYKKVK